MSALRISHPGTLDFVDLGPSGGQWCTESAPAVLSPDYWIGYTIPEGPSPRDARRAQRMAADPDYAARRRACVREATRRWREARA